MRILLFVFIFCQLNDARAISLYGDDNRRDTFTEKRPTILSYARSSAAMIKNDKMTFSKTHAKIKDRKLKEFQSFCGPVRFENQPLAALCSGTLIAPDIILTSGHCYGDEIKDCSAHSWVFDYKVEKENQSTLKVLRNQVYKCKNVLYKSMNASRSNTEDFALIKLDRPVKDRQPLKLKTNDEYVTGQKVIMIGYPLGLPQKIVDQGSILSVQDNTFLTNLDSFSGNSGSAIINPLSGEILGIMTGGNEDFEYSNTCVDLAQYQMEKGRELVMKINKVKEILRKL